MAKIWPHLAGQLSLEVLGLAGREKPLLRPGGVSVVQELLRELEGLKLAEQLTHLSKSSYDRNLIPPTLPPLTALPYLFIPFCIARRRLKDSNCAILTRFDYLLLVEMIGQLTS